MSLPPCCRCKSQPCKCQDGITLYCADCRDVLPLLEAGSVDLVLTDPPYGIRHTTGYGASWQNTVIDGDGDTGLRDWLVEKLNGCAAAIFGTWKTSPPFGARAALVWDKGPAFGMGNLKLPWKPSWELVWIFGDGWTGKREEGVLRGHLVVSWETRGRVHPHQKPESLCKYLMARHPAACILDPFAGSGTTLRAAKDLGRKAIGIEIEQKYCDIIVERLHQEVLPFGDSD